jgi:flagellar basal-body rod protein FlgB
MACLMTPGSAMQARLAWRLLFTDQVNRNASGNRIPMPMDIDQALGIHALALRLRAARAELLAANLANSDTPGFKARDLDFRAAFEQALGQTTTPATAVVLRVTHPAHLAGGTAGGLDPSLEAFVRYRVPMQPALDGNTVDARREQAEFMDNAVRYQASLTFLGGKLRTLLMAIRGE